MPFGLLVAGLLLVLLAIALAVWFVLRSNESTPSPSSTTVSTTAPPAPPTSEAPPPPASEAPPAPPQEEPPATQTITQPPETITQTRSRHRRRAKRPPPPIVRGPAACPGVAVVGVVAAAADPDAAVPDDPGSALCPGTDTAAAALGSRL